MPPTTMYYLLCKGFPGDEGARSSYTPQDQPWAEICRTYTTAIKSLREYPNLVYAVVQA